MRFRAWFFVVLLLCLYVAADSTTCSATKKCKQGCCNKSGNCGFGPDFESFLATYNFDGLDLDWEYPVDDKRGGRERDYITFPKFMTKLKRRINIADKGLTITLPASYWYLQYFDIKNLDQNVNWTQPYLNAHTNLTEIESALDLLWRNDISPSKVVMGLGFYGRAFTMASGSCKEPGCLFDGPANMGSCSREKGILLISEIDNEIKRRKLKPKLYKEEAIKVVTWGKQWVSYDDEETLQMKVDRAGERCLGGVMVWAISHDTKDARYNNALADILGRETSDASIGDEEKPVKDVFTPYEQCRWSNCKEPCPKGWVHVGRFDSDANTKDELMYDETGCGGDGQHSFCCPPEEDIPKCGWYGHDDGKCQKWTSCPSNMVEIGSNQMYYDDKPRVQTACCETVSNSMKAYGTCMWGEYPECNTDPKCPLSEFPTITVESGGGSGGLQCNNLKNDLGGDVIGVQTRKYCCNEDDDVGFYDCDYFRDEGPMIKGYPSGVCRSNCLSDRVRVAIDWPFEVCSAYKVGRQAWCCKTKYGKKSTEYTDKFKDYKMEMVDWMADPYCPAPSKDLKESSSSTALAVRDDKFVDTSPRNMLEHILGRVGSSVAVAELTKIWNDQVSQDDVLLWLQITYMSRYIRDNWRLDWEGPAAFAREVLCNPRYWARRIKAFIVGDKGSRFPLLNCTEVAPCYPDGQCGEPDDEITNNKRRHTTLFGRHSSHHSHSDFHRHSSRGLLVPREKKVLKIQDEDGIENEFRIEVPAHTVLREADENNPLLNRVAYIVSREPCSKSKVSLMSYKDAVKLFKVHLEHVLDKNIFERFITESCLGELVTGKPSKYGPVPFAFWEAMEDFDLSKGVGAPRLPGTGPQHPKLIERAYECLGSKNNDKVFMIADADINDAKGAIFALKQRPAKDSITGYMSHKDKKGNLKDAEVIWKGYKTVISRVRAAFSTLEYMKLDECTTRLNTIVKDVYIQFKHAENVYNDAYPPDDPADKVQIANYWLEWITNYYEQLITKFKESVTNMIAEISNMVESELDNDPEMADELWVVIRRFRVLRDDAKHVKLDISGFPAYDTPIDGGKDEDGDEEMGGT
ncbi:hypothetical protein BFJ69_g15354 [Fusarium oxysporum]|uniref:chitinase n=1 Tax=Fusarium oxysporum TaxID=5507 RepID=A0A420MEK1_FUSOX|nr:hypothetical protein BFJ69_g15354 [Fusarium oxysporum]